MKKGLEQPSKIEMTAMTAVAKMLDGMENSKDHNLEQARLTPEAYNTIIKAERIETKYGDFIFTDEQETLFFSYNRITALPKRHVLPGMSVPTVYLELKNSQSRRRQ